MKTYAYFPGCSLTGIGRPYDESIRAVFGALDVRLEEIPDWNCCGATSYMCIDEVKAVALAARNLALAEGMKREILAPCSACYLVLTKAKHIMSEYPEVGDQVRRGLQKVGLDYHGLWEIRHPLEILAGLPAEALQARIKRPLTGFRVAPYYGCQVVRPYHSFDDSLKPTTMDGLLRSLGAEVVDYPLKTRCCGGALMGTQEDVGVRLNFLLLKEAKRRGANVIATICPLCQYNLEGYQGQMKRAYGEDVSLPPVYLTQLMGLALGLAPKQVGLHRNLVTAPPLPATA